MPSPQKKSSTNGPKRYLIFEPNHILVTLIWDDRRFPGHANVCRCFFSKRLTPALS